MLLASDRFQVVATLGEGGMGVVYEAIDRDRDMRVAVKALRRFDPVSLLRFKREFRAASELSHPNIVNLYELVADGDELFFTMELVPGTSFIEYVRDGRPAASPPRPDPEVPAVTTRTARVDAGDTDTTVDMPGLELAATLAADVASEPLPSVHTHVALNRLRPAIRQLAEALHALHGVGLVHRDLKPSNIRVTPDERVVLMDFGIVADNRRNPRGARDAVGTPPFMAPEQAIGDPPTPAADWYGFGSLLYLALTGRLPFRGTRREILLAKQKVEPPPPGELVSGVPDDLEQLCVRLLRRSPHRRPSGSEVLRVLGADLRPADTATADLSLHPVFVGRAPELDALRAGFARACRGHTVSFVIEGESGMGKTALVRHFLDELEAGTGAGHRPFVLHARCHEREGLTYKGFDGIVDDLAAVLVSMPERTIAELLPADVDVLALQFPVLRRVPGVRRARSATTADPHALRARALTALAALVASLSRVRPLVIHIDDLQWAGRDSLDLMKDLLAGARDQRLLFVASVRSENLSEDRTLGEVIESLAAHSECRQLALGPLSNHEQRELVARMKGSGTIAPTHDAFWSQFGDSPLFLVELVRYLDDAGGASDSLAELSLDELLHRRVRRLEPGPRTVLESLAVADEPLPLSLVAIAAGLDPHDGERAAATLRVAHLARVASSDREPWLVCNHNRLRDVILRSLSVRHRREIHRRLAGALEGWSEATPENLARHWLAADEIEEATAYLRQGAAVATEKLAFDHAADLLRAALDLDAAHRPAAAAERGARLGELAGALDLAGRSYEAARTFEAAAALAEGDVALDLERRAADNLLRSGRLGEGIDKLSQVLDSLGAKVARTRGGAALSFVWRRVALAIRGLGYERRDEAELSARELGRLDTMYAAASSLGMVDHLRGAAIQARHLRTALQLGEERRVIRALAIEMAYLLPLGGRRLERGQRLGAELLDRARELDDGFLCGVVQLSMGGGLFLAGQPRDAIFALADGERSLAEIPGATWERVTTRYFLALAQAAVGDYHGVATTTERSLDVARRTRDLYARTFFACIPATWVRLRDDRAEEGERGLDRALDGWRDEGYHIGRYIESFSRAMVLIYRGDGDAAHLELERGRPHMRELMFHRMPWILGEVCALEARAALLSDDRARATEQARRLQRTNFEYNHALADAVFAALAHRDGERERAIELLTGARERFTAVGAEHLAAACAFHLAGLDAAEPDAGWAERQSVVNPPRFYTMLVPL